MARPRVAVFRPDDDRLTSAVELLESLGARPVPDPMLAVEPTGNRPDDAAGTGGDGFFAHAVDQPASEMGFEFLDVAAYRGLGKVNRVGGTGKAFQFNDFLKYFELP